MGIVAGAAAMYFLPFAGDDRETMFLPAALEAYMAESASFMSVSLISPGLPAPLPGEGAAPGKVPAGVVHLFEPVEVEEDEAEVFFRAQRLLDVGCEPVVEVPVVMEASEVVPDERLAELLGVKGVLG